METPLEKETKEVIDAVFKTIDWDLIVMHGDKKEIKPVPDEKERIKYKEKPYNGPVYAKSDGIKRRMAFPKNGKKKFTPYRPRGMLRV